MVSKKPKVEVFLTDFKTLKSFFSSKNNNSDAFSVRDNPGKGNFWKSYQNIITKDGIPTNFVKCKFCNRIDKYDTKTLGSKSLTAHSQKCSSVVRPIDAFVKRRNIQITADEKKAIIQAVVLFCCIDLRPFTTVQCVGFIQFLVVFSSIVARYGQLNQEEIGNILPCPNTVCEFKFFSFCFGRKYL